MNDKLKNNKYLKPIINAGDFFFRGPDEVTTGAPHVVDHMDIKRYMSMVIIALMPSTLAALYYYGFRALAIILVSYIAGGMVEVLFAIFKGDEIHEGFLVTGLIFPLVLPPTLPLWIVAVGSIFGVLFGKEVFGGTGRNIFNPALVGRLFITISFPAFMSSMWQDPITDAISSATPLTFIKAGEVLPYSIMDLLMGSAPGSMGETFRLGIIIGGIFLLVTKIANWRIPVAYLGTVFVLTSIGQFIFPGQINGPVLSLLTGGLLFGAFFMATDPVSSPYTPTGKIIYGIGLGFFTVLIRSFSGYTEGVMFSIILMNAFGPLIDTFIVQKKYKPIEE